jgi:hypothetical protein
VPLAKKWLLISLGGGFLVTAALFVLPDSFIAIADTPHPIADDVVQAVFWPVTVCVYLSGPGHDIGSPGKPMHEGTPVQTLAAFVGIGLSWTFYSSLVFFILRLRGKRRLLARTASNSR